MRAGSMMSETPRRSMEPQQRLLEADRGDRRRRLGCGARALGQAPVGASRRLFVGRDGGRALRGPASGLEARLARRLEGAPEGLVERAQADLVAGAQSAAGANEVRPGASLLVGRPVAARGRSSRRAP
jgi:hypothetical protein